jgi:hypothetical protein
MCVLDLIAFLMKVLKRLEKRNNRSENAGRLVMAANNETVIIVFKSFVSDAVYCFNGDQTVCIKAGSGRPFQKIMSGFSRDTFCNILNNLKNGSTYFLVRGYTAELCDKAIAENMGYEVLCYYNKE